MCSSDLEQALGIPLRDELIHVYLFDKPERFHRYAKQQLPDFAGRRALFVKSDTRLMVLAHWHDDLGEDLRHELIHGYLHAEFAWLPLWQRLATELVRGYADAVYTWHRRAWQSRNAAVCWWNELSAEEQRDLVPDVLWTADGARHQVTIYAEDGSEVVKLVRDIASEVSRGAYERPKRGGVRSMAVPRSLWRPLLGVDDRPAVAIRTVPVALNAGEERFLDHLDAYVAGAPEALAGAEVHVLRNESRRGLGFFVGTGFYPDFLVWVFRGAEQWVLFVDPKGAKIGRAHV